jgi:ribosomal-protein-serine acetyltransferase
VSSREHVRLPPGILMRRWRVGDAEALATAVAESAEHLRPWMPWIANEPLPLDRRRAMLATWAEDWDSLGDRLFGIFATDSVVGACGLHRRAGDSTLEIGYWVHVDHVGRGIAPAAAAAATDDAFRRPQIEQVEIHHDRANTASAAVPRKLGFELFGQRPVDAKAPAETGIHCIWVMRRERWRG